MNYLDYLRQFKIGPFAIFDTALAYLAIFLLSPLLTKLFSVFHLSVSRVALLWLTLPISVLFHLIFRQNTPLMKILSDPSQFSFYLSLGLLLLMTYLGLKDIKRL
ncbi:MAG: hypothetical protein WCV93_05280 [Candidatus Shapirobacteria bacterium]|jgi:hypothetical protein